MGKPLRVLVVEDSEDDAELVVRELRRGGYDLDWLRVDTAPAMQRALAEGRWDLVVSDYSLPAFSGLAALEAVQSSGLDIPFLMVSGLVGEETAVAVMKAGAQDFFVKGQLARFLAAISRELREAEARREQRGAAIALREANDRFDAFMNNMPIPAWIKNEKYRYVYVNQPMAALWQRATGELLGCTDYDVMPREVARSLRVNDTRVIDSSKALNVIETMLNAQGEYAIFTVIKFPLRDAAGGRLVGGVAIDITERVQSREQLEIANRRLQILSSKVMEIQERERQHIAAGLHDDVGQALTAVKINLESARLKFPALAEARQLEDSVRIVEAALQQVRTLSFDLRPPQLDDLGLAAALRWYVDRKTSAAGIVGHTRVDDLAGQMHPDIETACFRIAQEAMTNVLRHAGASHVWIELRRNGKRLHLMVRDDGKGCDIAAVRERAARGYSLGLVSMEERAALVGGQVELASQPGRGMVVDVFLPVQPLPAARPAHHEAGIG